MPTLAQKAFRWARKASSRGTVSDYVLNAPHQYGQPLRTDTTDAYGLVTPQKMREVILKTPTAAACFNAIIDFCLSVPIDVRNVDPALPADDMRVRNIRSLMEKPNPADTWTTFAKKWMKDVLTFGYAGVEIERNANGGIANLYVLDNARVRVDYDEHGNVLGYDMLDARGVPVKGKDKIHGWLPQDVIWFNLDPDSAGPYGKSRVIQLFAAAVLESMMMTFIGGRFTDSNIPFGVMDLGELSDTEVEYAIDKWNEQAAKNGDHRIIITGSRGGAKWMPFGYHLKDLDASALLMIVRKQIMGILGVTANELGESEDINKSNGYNLSFTFKKRAIEPVLRELTTKLTAVLLHEELGYHDLELYYAEIDSRDELLQAQIDDLYFKIGIHSVNHIRNRKGLPNIDGGDEPFIFTGRDWIPVSLVRSFAEAQLQSLLLVNAEMMVSIQQLAAGGTGQGTGDGAGIKPPRVNVPSLPDMPQLPGTVGHSGASVRYPKPPQLTGAKPKNNQSPTRPRGAVQNLRNAGLRKEDMS